MVRERILVVEDEVLIAQAISQQLHALGYVVVGSCDNGATALEMTADLQPDLVLMDIVLNGPVNGIETAAQVQHRYNTPVVFLTAHADDAVLDKAKGSDPFGYVLKPSSPRELHAVITLAVYRAKTTRELQLAAWSAATLSGICDAVITLDPQRRVSSLNPAAEKLLHIDLTHAQGKSIETLLALPKRTDGQSLSTIIDAVVASWQAFRCDKGARVILPDGSEVPVHFSVSPIQSPSRELLGITLVVHDDTERVKAEQALRDSEFKFRTLAETSDCVIMVYRERFLYVNAAAERVSGYSQSELLQKKLQDLVHPDYNDIIAAGLRQRLAGEVRHQQYQIKIVAKGGDVRWVDISAGMIQYEGAPAGLATAFDVTDRVNAEAAQRTSQLQLKEILDNTAALIYIKDLEGRYLLVNTQFEKIMGMQHGQMLGRTDYDWLPKDIADDYRRHDARVIAADEVGVFDEQALQKEGMREYVSVKVPLHDSKGKINSICGISTDITEQRRREYGLARLNNRMRELGTLLENEQAFDRAVCQGIVELVDADIAALPCLDVDGTHFTYRDAVGARAGLVRGKTMAVQGGGLCGWVAEHGQALNVPNLIADPRVLPDLVRAWDVGSALILPLLHNGQVVGGLSAFRKGKPFDALDQELLTLFSERVGVAMENMRLLKTLQDRVVERSAQLADSNAELEAFCYSLSHDLRGPLRGIQEFSQLLLGNYGPVLDTRGQDYLHQVRKSAMRMNTLIDDLLALSRVSHSVMHRESVDLSALTTEAVARLQAATPDRRVHVDIAPGIVGEGDAQLLQVGLENLLGNAWNLTRKQAHAQVAFGATTQDGQTVYFVRDNGVGFDMARAENVFGVSEPVYSDEGFEGAGISLATVHGVIQRHGGKVWAESEPGRGATFYFTL